MVTGLTQAGINRTESGIRRTASAIVTVDATLNNQSAEIVIKEDTNSDGTPDRTEKISLNDGQNTYTLSNISGGPGNEYWIEANISNSNIQKTAEINSIELRI